MSCHSFPKKGTPLGSINTLSVLRLTGLVHIVIVIIIIMLFIFLYSTGLCCNKVI